MYMKALSMQSQSLTLIWWCIWTFYLCNHNHWHSYCDVDDSFISAITSLTQFKLFDKIGSFLQ